MDANTIVPLSTLELIIGLEWLYLFVGFIWAAALTYRLARGIDGPPWVRPYFKQPTLRNPWPIRWPVPGRYVLANMLIALAVVSLDASRIRLEPYGWRDNWPVDTDHWSVFVVRTYAAFALTWVIFRLKRGGLVGRTSSKEPERLYVP
jgi:hypothetical protein